MNEAEARQELQIRFDWKKINSHNFSDSSFLGGYVSFYIGKMYKEFSATWSNELAVQFIGSLRAAEGMMRDFKIVLES